MHPSSRSRVFNLSCLTEQLTNRDLSKGGAPVGSPLGSPVDSPLGSLPSSPVGYPPDSLPDSPVGSLPDSPGDSPGDSAPGSPGGSLPGSPVGSLPDSPVGSLPDSSVGSPPGSGVFTGSNPPISPIPSSCEVLSSLGFRYSHFGICLEPLWPSCRCGRNSGFLIHPQIP